MHKIKLPLIFICISFASCVTLYKPNQINTPLLQEKGEGSLQTGLGVSGNGLLNAQSAYAIGNQAAIMINTMYHTRKFDSTNTGNNNNERLKMYAAEFGLGYFKSLNEKKSGLFQCYGGSGLGYTSDKVNGAGTQPYITANYANIFLQPGIALINTNVDLSFDIRANFVQMFNVNSYLYTKFEWWNTDFILHQDTTFNFINIEPAITLRIGDKRLKGFLQLGAIIPVYNPENYLAVNTSSYLIFPLIKSSLGLTYTIGRK
jgi:hypothetical protein